MTGLVRGTAAIMAAMVPSVAIAVDLAPDIKPAPPPNPGWTIALGAEARVLPRYQGSEDYIFVPVPLIDVRRAGTPARFHSPRDNFGVAILDTGRFEAGPVATVEFARRVKHNPGLQGLGNVATTLEVGGYFNYWFTDWLRGRAELRQGFGGHHGIVSDEALDVVVPVTPQWTLSGGPRMTVATKAANEPYFGVTPAQSEASGLPVFDAGGGVRSVGIGTQARYQWNAQWASHAYFEYNRLTGDPGSSPLVTMRGSPNQAMIGFGTTYSFDIPPLW
jgi:outer membrane protein